MRHIYTRVLALVAIGLAACNGATALPPSPTVSPVPASPASTVQPSLVPATPVPTVTTPLEPTPTPHAQLPITHLAPANFTNWDLADPNDPDQANAIVPVADSYHLDPDWEVSSIEYVYKWWGLADPIFDYQIALNQNGQIKMGDQKVDPQAWRDLLAALSNLYPSISLQVGQDHTDDYPSWALELTGKDGRRVELFSESSANPNAAPWNVLNNGRLYVQYDGSLGAAISKVFTSGRGQPAAAFYPGGRDPNSLVFASQGLPLQLLQGFEGLLPVSDAFSYEVVPQDGVLRGYVEGRSSIGGMGNMVIGTLTDLISLKLTGPDKGTITCTTKSVKSDDPAAARWTFECPLGSIQAGQTYRYPIAIQLGTSSGTKLKTEGVLYGKVPDPTNSTITILPVADPWLSIFNADPDFADLLSSHQILDVNFSASLPSADPTSGTYNGDVLMLGEAEVQGQKVAYTVGTPFTIEKGRLTFWHLNTQTVNALLSDALALPLTQQVYKALPTTNLHLWYAEDGQMKDPTYLMNYYGNAYGVRPPTCGVAQSPTFPTNDAPLRAFGFHYWDVSRSEFVLNAGQVLVNYLDFDTDTPKELVPVLVPDKLRNQDGLIFPRVTFDSAYKTSSRLEIYLPYGLTESETAAYTQAADALGFPIDRQYDTIWDAENVQIKFDANGHLALAPCKS